MTTCKRQSDPQEQEVPLADTDRFPPAVVERGVPFSRAAGVRAAETHPISSRGLQESLAKPKVSPSTSNRKT